VLQDVLGATEMQVAESDQGSPSFGMDKIGTKLSGRSGDTLS